MQREKGERAKRRRVTTKGEFAAQFFTAKPGLMSFEAAHIFKTGFFSNRREGSAEMNERAEILVTSSETASRQALCRILEGLGAAVPSCSTISAAVELLGKKQIGLVFCDDRLVDGSYRELLDAVRAFDNKPRIIVTTRTGEWREFMEAIRLGAFDMIPSPFNATDVERSIARVFRQPSRLRSVA